MKKFNGFSLIEVITSLLILGILVTIFLPIIHKVYVERSSIWQEQEALYYTNEIILDWLEDIEIESHVIESNSTIYHAHIESEKNELLVCLEWIASNNRKYERCEHAKKK